MGNPNQPHISPLQWKLPAGYALDGNTMIPLEDLVAIGQQSIPAANLTGDQWRSLTLARLSQLDEFALGVLGVGIIDKGRAIAEVQADSEVGRALVESHKLSVAMVIEDARAAVALGLAPKRPGADSGNPS